MRVQVQEATNNPENLVVRCARNDYKSEWVGDYSDEELLSEIQQGDESLDDAKCRFIVRTLIKKGHYGPFEHPQISFAIEGVSRSLMAQITRHRTGITFDIQSQRYVDFAGEDPLDLIKTPKSVEEVDAGNRNPDQQPIEDIIEEQFNVDTIPDDYTPEEWLARDRRLTYEEAVREAVNRYNRLRELGVPPEDARFVLPIGSKVNITTTMNARTLLHIADMRAQADAQWEVRELTGKLLDCAEEWMPHTFGYYRDEMIHRKNRLAP